ncbi:MAG: c-type cytochrome [Burkholderiales bacterium]|nr:c-type cytochrome [Burkholderiales bacterium]
MTGPAQACGEEPPPTLTGRYSIGAHGEAPSPEKLAELGRKIFFDPSLSASGKQACASCHNPAHAYGPANALPVQKGGPHLTDTGFRNTPALRYLHGPFAFTEHFVDLADGKQNAGPAGGRTWDGRVNLAREQALMPLLDAKEMANQNLSEVVARVRKAPYAQEFDELLSPPGTHILDDEEGVISWLTSAIEFFEQSVEDFHPFTSKYDAYLKGRTSLTPSELRGVKLFTNKDKANCATCHPVTAISAALPFPRFTDFEYTALGVPRNRAISANRDPAFHDLGLCGPLRKDLMDKPEYCGRFRTPTLRNVALRRSFFHNGVFHSLHEVLAFYATRDTDPARWYGKDRRGKVIRFDDLPDAYHGNVNQDAPFKPLPNGRPRLNEQDIRDLEAFLRTLTDGYVPPPVKLIMREVSNP